MAFTYGFFNSLRGDRKYNAEQISEIFDGILADGIIPTVGGLFAVTTANNGMQINVASGRAWFNHTWSKNDSTMILTVPDSDITRPRYDAVVLEVNHEQEVRANAIKIVTGVPAVNTVKPILINNEKVHQYPLAYILVPAGATTIRAEDIENAVGLSPTVFATGILETAPLDDLWAQWKGEFDAWFAAIKLQLSGDIVTNLQYQIDQLREQLNELSESIDIQFVTHVEVITESKTWRNETGKNINATVMCFGGGGGYVSGSIGGGGGGGHMKRGTVSLSAGASVNITIGEGGSVGSSVNASKGGTGGTTSFGTYLSANGGETGVINNTGVSSGNGAGGSGGSGGGGGCYNAASGSSGRKGGAGGSGSYGGGGGGGGGGGYASGTSNITHAAGGNGGSGGTYGGGGGGGGTGGTWSNLSSTTNNGGSGGAAGGNGGAGGRGGTVHNKFGNNDNVISTSPLNGSAGKNTIGMSVDFTGTGAAGICGKNSTGKYNLSSYWATGGGGGGGGGGGYGGVGGNGGDAYAAGYSGSYDYSGGGGGGGGGGGYGAKGGDGASSGSTTSVFQKGRAGGGGGGYGGAGRDGGNMQGGGGGGYGPNNYGAGGGNGSSMSGCVVITYTTKEIIVN